MAPSKIHKPDFTMLKDANVATKFDDIVSNTLTTEQIEAECTIAKLDRLNRATKEAIKSLPPKKRQPIHKRFISAKTRELIAERENPFDSLPPAERRLRNREISRSCRYDYRTYIKKCCE